MCVERQSAAGCGDLLLRHLEGKLMREPRARDRERKRERERGEEGDWEIRERNRLGGREIEGQAHAPRSVSAACGPRSCLITVDSSGVLESSTPRT